MKLKSIYLIILAIFFLGIVIYDLFTRFNKNDFKEGLDNDSKENPNVKAATSYLYNRYYPKSNPTGLPDKTILEIIGNLSSYGNADLDAAVIGILKSTDKTEEKIVKLNEIFGIPLYDPLSDGLVIYYDFKEIAYITNSTTNTTKPVIANKTPNSYNNDAPSTFDANIMMGETAQKEIGTILDSTTPIINGSHLQLLGGNGQQQNRKNGAYLLLNDLPTFYDKNQSFLGFSCSVWFNSNGNTGVWSRIIDFGNGAGYQNIFITNNCWGHKGYIAFWMDRGNGWGGWARQTIENIYVNNNAWIHLVWTISTNGEWKVYLNNDLALDNVYGIPTNSNRKTCFIGKSSWDWDGLYNGKMADFRIYQKEISAEVVSLLYNLGNITDNGLPVRKYMNLIQNGSFISPKLNDSENLREEGPKLWEASRHVLHANVGNNGYSNHLGMNQALLGYSPQYAIITGNGGYLIKRGISILPNIQYELSFLHCLWSGSNDRDVHLNVRLGCYVDSGKSVVPRVSNFDQQNLPGWQKYSIIFDTDKDCTGDETLKIILFANANPNANTTCAIASVSLRKVKDLIVSNTAVPLPAPGMGGA